MQKEIETPALRAHEIEDSTDIFGISGGGGLNPPNPHSRYATAVSGRLICSCNTSSTVLITPPPPYKYRTALMFCKYFSTEHGTGIPYGRHQVFNDVPATLYRGADKSLAQPTSRCILFDGENISFDASLVI